uniref:Protein kinase domain-containing protein n=1 Tax=Periophthalmus magnuspinnatus TaxID=409849 RepID=A0A3B4AG85_9GOBI
MENNSHPKYKVLQLLGEGVYGKVAKCRNRVTGELVALKVMKIDKNMEYYFRKEVEMLGLIKSLDPDTFNLIKFIEHFEYDDRQCMAFEMLDISVDDQMEKQEHFSLNEIRPMAKQLLVTLFGLKSIGVLHTDIKPDNIMLVDQEKQPFKLKLIDFGVAKRRDGVQLGQSLQPVAYRSPEVVLGLPLWEAMDMWTLACCLLIWYLGGYGLGCKSLFDQLTKIVNIIGVPSDEMLNEEVIKEFYDFDTCPEFMDREAFHDLLKKMFALDPHKRITPAEALLHPFITMEHLPDGYGYRQMAQDFMQVAQTDSPLLQRENLKKAAEHEQEKRDKALAARRKADPVSISPVNQPDIPEDVGNSKVYAEQSTCPATYRLDCYEEPNAALSGEKTLCQSAHEKNEETAPQLSEGSPTFEPRAEETTDQQLLQNHEAAQAEINLEGGVSEAEDDVPPEEEYGSLEIVPALDEMKEESDYSEILEDIQTLFEEGDATEVQISEEAETAPRSIFGRLIPRPLRELWSRMHKGTSTNKPVLRKPKWLRIPKVFTKRSAAATPSRN